MSELHTKELTDGSLTLTSSYVELNKFLDLKGIDKLTIFIEYTNQGAGAANVLHISPESNPPQKDVGYPIGNQVSSTNVTTVHAARINVPHVDVDGNVVATDVLHKVSFTLAVNEALTRFFVKESDGAGGSPAGAVGACRIFAAWSQVGE